LIFALTTVEKRPVIPGMQPPQRGGLRSCS
jgi:hypothetical protein